MSERQCWPGRLLAERGGITGLRRPVARKPGLLAGPGRPVSFPLRVHLRPRASREGHRPNRAARMIHAALGILCAPAVAHGHGCRGAPPLARLHTACLLLLGALALALPVPVQAQAPMPSVCDRTSQVRDVIVSAVSGVSNCANITTTHLAAILELEFSNNDNTGIRSLQSGDFAGLTGLEFLSLHDNNPVGSGRTLTLPADIFDGLASLEELDLGRNVIQSLPTGVFDDLTALTDLNLVGGDIVSVSANVFSRLSNLESLYLTSTAPTLPAGIFDGLTKLTELQLGSPSADFSGMTSIRSDLFDELTALESLRLEGHNLSMLPADILDNLARLTTLIIGDNGLTSLPAGIFNNLAGLTTLAVVGEAFSSLPPGIFDHVTRLTFLRLDENRLQTLPDDLFERLTALQALIFDGNPGTESFVPTAVAGDNQAVGPGAAVTLDAAASGGAWGTNVTYAWTQTSGTPVILTGADTATPSFTAPDSPGDLEFELAVMGVSCGAYCQGDQPSSLTSTDRVTVRVGPVVSITPGLLSVAEDAGEAVLTVSLHRPAESGLSVSWHTQDERADAPNDYTARQDAVTFAAGEDRKTISVPIVDDAVREDPVHDVHETFFVILEAGQGYSRSDSSYALVEIVDNDGDAAPDVTPPRLLQRTVNGTTLVLTYDETLDDASVPAVGDFVVQSGGNTINVSQVSVDGSKVTLTLAAAVPANQAVSIDYTPGANPIQDAAGNDAAPLSGTDVTPPQLTRAAVNAGTLVLTYDETLDAASAPAPGDFVVTAAGSATGVNGVSVGGSAVTLTLAAPVQANQTVTLDYTPGANPTQDVAGNDAAALSGQAVTNNTPGSGEGSGGGGGGDPSVPGAPASLTATAGEEEVALVWSVPADDGGAPVTGYEYRYVAGDAVPGDTPWQSAGLNLGWTVTGLTNGQDYAFEVRARNRVGEGPARGALATPVGRLGAPASLTATAGDEEVVLAWSAPADDGGAPVTGYEYRYAAGDAVPRDTPWQSAGLNLEWTVTGLTNGRQYAFEVRARNREGEGEARGALATPVGRPGVLASLTATAGDGEVALAWSAPADDGGAPVTGYEYRYAAGGEVPGPVPWQEADGDRAATVTELENETRHAFEVRARNRVGEGEAAKTTALPLRLRAELFSSASAVEGEALVIGVRRSGGLAVPAHAYIGVTDSALPSVTATEEGRDDGLGRHRLEFAAGAAEATVAVTIAFDGELRQDRALTATLDSAESEVDDVTRAHELVTPTLVVPVTEGDAGVSVADARVQGKSAVLAFTVSMDRTRDVPVRVDYATEDGSARAGEDYTPVTGTLTIAPGGREGTIEVPVLPALHVTGERTLTLRLSNARGAVIDDASATGTIVRESELPKAWLARFGRTASDHAAQAIAGRLEIGQRETQVTVAGRRVDGLSVDGLVSGALPSRGGGLASTARNVVTRLAAPALAASGASGAGQSVPGVSPGAWGGAPGGFGQESSRDAGQALRRAVLPDFGFRLPKAEEALLGSSFYVEGGAQQAEGGGTWAAWGDVAATRFEGDANGLALDGDVVTGTVGLDRQWRALLVGLALSRSSGEGGYGTGAGSIASTLTSVHPYVQVRLADRAQLWGAAGWGRGGFEITPESGTALEADLTNRMGALGGRAVLAGAGALEIALRSDLLWTETSSDETAGLAEAVGTASRGRLMLEGAGRIQGLGGVMRPRLEGGVRYDRGDAETGRGFEVGGGLGWARGSLMLEASGRVLVAHADESYEEWGYSGSLVYAPGADGLGLQMRVGSTAGAAASGVRNLWMLENASGLVRAGGMPFAQRFDAEVGYGLGRGTLWYPYFVADDSGLTRLGLELTSADVLGVGLEFGRREGVDQAPEDAMLLRGELRF